jgi:hypothetical protein
MIVATVERPTGLRERCAERCPTHGVYRWFRMPGTDRVAPCPTCDRERRQRRQQRARSVRQPPRPPYEAATDTCSLCGQHPLPVRRRSWCSDDCVDLWYIATTSRYALHHLVGLHGHACWGCGATVEPGRQSWRHWEGMPLGPPEPMPVELFVDHVRPLWSLTDPEREQLRWWLPANLQLLCGGCHADKTRAEAAERAALRRATS